MAKPPKPDLVFNEPVATGWVRVEYYGDQELAAAGLHQARMQLGMMRTMYGVNQRVAEGEAGGFYHLTKEYADGWLIQTITNDGHDTVRINAQRVAPQGRTRQIVEQPPGSRLSIAGYYWLDPDEFDTFSFLAHTATDAIDLGVFEPNDDYIYSWAAGVSGFGTVVGATVDSDGNDIAYQWKSNTGMTDLGTTGDYRQMTAAAISYDGSVICGVEYIDNPFPTPDTGPVHWRWTEQTGMVQIGLAADTSLYPHMSASGKYIVGGVGDYPYSGMMWTHTEDGEVTTEFEGVPHGVSDGAIVVGARGDDYFDTPSLTAFRRDMNDGTETDLGTGVASGISADGVVVVGYSRGEDEQTNTAWYWTEARGRVEIGAGQPWAVTATDTGYVAVGSQTILVHHYGPEPSLDDFPPEQRPYVIVLGDPPHEDGDKLGGVTPIIYYPVTVPPILWDETYRVPEGSAFAAVVVPLTLFEVGAYPGYDYKVIGYCDASPPDGSWIEAVAVFAIVMPTRSDYTTESFIPVMWELTPTGATMTQLGMPGNKTYGEATAVTWARAEVPPVTRTESY